MRECDVALRPAASIRLRFVLAGDITKSANIEHFREQVMRETHDVGLHMIMGDGGFSVSGKEVRC